MTGGESQLRRERLAAIAAQAGDADAGEGGDPAVRRYLAHAVAFELGDIEVAGGVEREVARRHELGVGGRAAIAERTFAARAGEGRDRAVRRYFAHAVVAEVRDVEVAGGVEREAVGLIEPRAQGRPAIAAQAGPPGAGDGGDPAVPGHLADAVVFGIGDVDVALGVDGDALGEAQLRVDGGAAIAEHIAAGYRLNPVSEGSGGGRCQCQSRHGEAREGHFGGD